MINAKKFLEDLDDQPLSPDLKKARADLYKFYAAEQSSNRDELPGVKSSENDGLEIYDDPTTLQDEPGIHTSVIEEEEYDMLGLEEIKEDDEIKGAEFAGNSSRILSSIADHKAWLWRKENLLKTSRYWALIYSSSLYLYKAAQDEAAVEVLQLQAGTMKKHKKGVKFVLVVEVEGKGGKHKQHQLHTENEEKTSQWIKALERGIAGAGRPGRGKAGRKEKEEGTMLGRTQSRASTVSGQ